MSSKVWSIMRDVFTVERLIGATAGYIAAHIWLTLPDNIHSLLHLHKAGLEQIRDRISHISVDQRECLRIAAQQENFSSLEQIEHKLQSLLDDRFELVYRANQSNFLERILPARLSKLWADINKLDDAVKEVRQEFIAIHRRGDRAQAGVLPMHVGPYDTTASGSHGLQPAQRGPISSVVSSPRFLDLDNLSPDELHIGAQAEPRCSMLDEGGRQEPGQYHGTTHVMPSAA